MQQHDKSSLHAHDAAAGTGHSRAAAATAASAVPIFFVNCFVSLIYKRSHLETLAQPSGVLAHVSVNSSVTLCPMRCINKKILKLAKNS